MFCFIITLLLFKLSIQTLATSPNRYAAGISGSTANCSYLVEGIRAALSFSQECGMAELLTKSDRLDIQSLCSRVMPSTPHVLLSTSDSTRTVSHQ
uniref:Secreted protein n=1 Tax=Acanthochromis polyacanthus TaxID=80966 RepID=A0A3Q1H4J4_9TELE